MKVVEAIKNGAVIAEKVKPGKTIKVYTKNGNLETIETAKENQWLLTRASIDTQAPVIDDNGNKNQWFIDDNVFKEKYEFKNMEATGFVMPVCSIQTFEQLEEDRVIHASWGDQFIKKGGWLNVTNPNDIYGIAKEEFEETYHIIDDITELVEDAEREFAAELAPIDPKTGDPICQDRGSGCPCCDPWGGCNMSDSDCPYKTEKPATPKKENRSGEDFPAFVNRNGEPDNSISWALQNRRIQLKAEIGDSICGPYLVDEYGDKYPQ